ncbi:hypothetical protein MANES_18G031400v8 [Manihot esculenta]|uniref:Uncharacterized protein n=1 Tax=Manihot esculenta TaxID=3983 RepID=A0ACB7FXZ9_MANES|nr:hypothetical protein MANES_18G031400v8 [Manihot esculenta]
MYAKTNAPEEEEEETSVDCFSDGFDYAYFDDAVSTDDLFLESNYADDCHDHDHHASHSSSSHIIIKHQNYRILKEDDIHQRMEDDLAQVSSVLSLPKHEDMVDLLVSREDRNKYARCFVRSYILEKKKIKWCPGRDCDCAIEFFDGDAGFDVTCHCFTSFCWNCDDESHRPVDCETVKKWISKNQSESENVNYILTYCKPCPNCRRPIEKNQGCMHMTCRVCMYSFCWLCLAPYENHGQCNGYLDNAVRKKEMAKQSLEKYTHYFERWDANRKSKLKALADFQHIKDVKFKRLSEIQGIPEDNMDFITKAWLQVVECRRVLEWSYAYGYYLPENELAKKQFFEYLQGEAESRLEKLHDCAEKELEQFLDSDGLSKDFIKFRTMLLTLTVVTGDYFEKLVRVLENGLSDVVSHGASSSPEEAEDYWFCDLCTYANPGSVLECQMCVSLDEDEV